MNAYIVVALSISGLLIGCGSPGGGSSHSLLRVEISPADVTLEVVDGVVASQDFQATAYFADGTNGNVTNDVQWSIDDGIAAFTGSQLAANGARGGQSLVHAHFQVEEDTATVRVIVRDASVVSGAPPDSATHFGGTNNVARNPIPSYPENEVLLPPNIPPIAFQWTAQGGTDLYDVQIQSDFLDLHFYTTDPHWTPTASDWDIIRATHRGDEVHVSIAATKSSENNGAVGHSAVRDILFAEEDVEGAVYYWANEGVVDLSKGGVWRFDFAEHNTAQRFYTETEAVLQNGNGTTSSHCVGCHALSRDGSRMAARYNGNAVNVAGTIDVATRAELIRYQDNLQWSFSAFHPDGSKLVTVKNGEMRLINSQTGADMGVIPSGISTMPDWSPNTSKLAFITKSDNSQQDHNVGSGSLAFISYNGGVWGSVTTLLAASGSFNNFYPSFSPDSQWLIFNRAASGSYNAPSAAVWGIKAVSGSQPIRLDLAQGGAGVARTDSWPRFAPFQQTYKGEPIFWFTVSSLRPYGHLGNSSLPYIWMASFRPSKAQVGEDPSTPAFWLPQQNIATHNHIAQWAEYIVNPG